MAAVHARRPLGAAVWRHGGNDMIEEAVILVVRQKKRGGAPSLGIRGQGIHDLRDVPCAIICRPVGMFSVSLGRDDPRYLGQTVAPNILAEDIEERSAGFSIGAHPRLFEER